MYGTKQVTCIDLNDIHSQSPVDDLGPGGPGLATCIYYADVTMWQCLESIIICTATTTWTLCSFPSYVHCFVVAVVVDDVTMIHATQWRPLSRAGRASGSYAAADAATSQ